MSPDAPTVVQRLQTARGLCGASYSSGPLRGVPAEPLSLPDCSADRSLPAVLARRSFKRSMVAKILQDVLKAGFTTYNWTSQRIPAFADLCKQAITTFEAKLDAVHSHSQSIEQVLEHIAKTKLIVIGMPRRRLITSSINELAGL